MAKTDLADIRKLLKEYVERITRKSHGKFYVCPLCHSGEHKNKTGAFSITDDGEHWTCFACNNDGDIFDLIGLVENIPTFPERLKRVKEIFLIDDSEYQKPPKNERKALPNSSGQLPDAAPEKVHFFDKRFEASTSFFREAHQNISKTDYIKSRGISDAVINRFNIGYVEDWHHPKRPSDAYQPRLIIPTSEESYVARAILPEHNTPEDKVKKVGSVHFLNIGALKTATKPIFITEGEIDALSVMTMTGEAIALGGTGGVKKFLDTLVEIKPVQPLLLALDMDEEGREAQEKLKEGLNTLGIPFFEVDIFGGCKDPNEYLMKDNVGFAKAIDAAEFKTKEAEIQMKKDYAHTATFYKVPDFLRDAQDISNAPIPTGFDILDTALDGGLYEGAYFFGAITALGKTTFVAQIADQVAASGHDILFFSLEMATKEIIAKSISRLTYYSMNKLSGNERDAKTLRSLTSGVQWMKFSRKEREIVDDAVARYGEFSKHIFIHEGVGDIGVDKVREVIKNHIAMTGNRPVVFIDYIQILAPHDPRSTDKQNTDKAVVEIKRISRDFKIPVLGISSFNRENYHTTVGLTSFKESGAVEYSSDVLIGLQMLGIGSTEEDFNIEEAYRADPRSVELIILKNRNGAPRTHIVYDFKQKFNVFFERYERTNVSIVIHQKKITRPKGGKAVKSKHADPTADAAGENTEPTPENPIFDEIITGEMLDTEGNHIYMEIGNAGGQRWPVALIGEDRSTKWILSEKEYKEIIEYNRENNSSFQK